MHDLRYNVIDLKPMALVRLDQEARVRVPQTHNLVAAAAKAVRAILWHPHNGQLGVCAGWQPGTHR